TLWTATALAYPFIRYRVHRFVDRVVLRRADYRELRQDFASRLSLARTIDEALDVACVFVARALGTAKAMWSEHDLPRSDSNPSISLNALRTQATIAIPTSEAPAYEIRVAEMTNGRVLLSDDLALIDAIAALVSRRINEMRSERQRMQLERRDREMRQLATEAELRALRAQLNPHFLFNTLNTLGHLMSVAPDRASATLYRLTSLLRAVLRKTDGQFVALSEELEIVESYLAIERERFEERLTVTFDIPAELRLAGVPPLILQPLVENAVKHGIAPCRAGGTITIRAWRDVADGDVDGHLRLAVIDTGRGSADTHGVRGPGVGLANIEGRLKHYFGAGALLSLGPTRGGGTTVELCIPWISRDRLVDRRPASDAVDDPMSG
ncbi:MAG TPA: histidine kinase, partial [Gemmatimonadaceae bacterium]|nr:histidine kinase [Gemmatimonadaceae bacterium]